MRRLFEGRLIWKLDATKNCSNYGLIIFCFKTFDFDYILASALIPSRYLLTSLSQMGRLL